MEYKNCSHVITNYYNEVVLICDVCDTMVFTCDTCVDVNKGWCICGFCKLTCSTCGERDFSKFGGHWNQRCIGCYRINHFCEQCIKGKKSKRCKDCENL